MGSTSGTSTARVPNHKRSRILRLPRKPRPPWLIGRQINRLTDAEVVARAIDGSVPMIGFATASIAILTSFYGIGWIFTGFAKDYGIKALASYRSWAAARRKLRASKCCVRFAVDKKRRGRNIR